VARLVGVALGQPADTVATRLRASMVLGPIAALHSGRTNMLAILGWPDYDGERLTAVKAALRVHTRAALTAPMDDGFEPAGTNATIAR
jgi:hypothetical protein